MNMASRRQRRKQSRDRMGAAGIALIVIIVGGFLFFAYQLLDPVDSKNCSINDGPKGVTAIVFDKSYPYSSEQVTDIKTSFNLWLAGKEATTKNRRIDLNFFSEGTLVQLYVTDNQMVSSVGGLMPEAELCVPKGFEDANPLYSNPEMLEESYQKFIKTFTDELDALLLIEEGTSPIMETFVRLSNSESFQNHPNKPHNLFIISDMLQNSKNYSHYEYGEGPSWKNFEKKMNGTVYMRPRLNGVKWQVFFAKRSNQKEKAIQGSELSNFWQQFFYNANAIPSDWILIDG